MMVQFSVEDKEEGGSFLFQNMSCPVEIHGKGGVRHNEMAITGHRHWLSFDFVSLPIRVKEAVSLAHRFWHPFS